MKNILHTLLISVIGFTGFAQTEPEKKDTTELTFGDKKVLIIDKKLATDADTATVDWDFKDSGSDKYELTHWGGVDFGVNILLNKNGGTGLDSADQWLQLDHARSLSWRINIFEEKIKLYKNYVGIIIGAGLTYNSYGLKNNVTVVSTDSLGTFGVNIDKKDQDFSKNKLRASYINVPLMLEFNTSEDHERSFHLAAGVIGGWKMGSITKQKWEDGDDKYNARRKADFNITPFTLDATARIGYKNFTAFATYGLTPLFKKDKGPEVYPMTVGIQLVPW